MQQSFSIPTRVFVIKTVSASSASHGIFDTVVRVVVRTGIDKTLKTEKKNEKQRKHINNREGVSNREFTRITHTKTTPTEKGVEKHIKNSV